MNDALRCQFCKCSETNPCTVEDGDVCILNTRSGVCSAPGCRRAEIAAREAAKAKRRQEQRLGPWKVTRRDENGRATCIVRRKRIRRNAA